MIVLLDTSTPECRLTLIDSDMRRDYTWQADRDLAHHLLGFLRDRLSENGASFTDISAIGVMKGPGSFTGLRIGLTVMNTIATDRHLPIVGETGESWRDKALKRLQSGENDQLVMPEYGSAPHITTPRK
ncbi:MAG TPA: tRNA (adenosine(37)-N6)-threonylcarbamoyltransferase complex dimerization subunit type 1 TsaB [Candidatus Saccharimonadaceae bacterium]|nr:tRNA (adenosine(37)-N6)-threonylcarbamoyltransferase complex dimerization subunit type 1 TsaB [Candidatus Saccharimonadaceae bacterium]